MWCAALTARHVLMTLKSISGKEKQDETTFNRGGARPLWLCGCTATTRPAPVRPLPSCPGHRKSTAPVGFSHPG